MIASLLYATLIFGDMICTRVCLFVCKGIFASVLCPIQTCSYSVFSWDLVTRATRVHSTKCICSTITFMFLFDFADCRLFGADPAAIEGVYTLDNLSQGYWSAHTVHISFAFILKVLFLG